MMGPAIHSEARVRLSHVKIPINLESKTNFQSKQHKFEPFYPQVRISLSLIIPTFPLLFN